MTDNTATSTPLTTTRSIFEFGLTNLNMFFLDLTKFKNIFVSKLIEQKRNDQNFEDFKGTLGLRNTTPDGQRHFTQYRVKGDPLCSS